MAPITGTWLIQATGNSSAPAFFLTFVGVLSLIGLALSRETARTELVDVQSEVGKQPVPSA